MSEELEVLKLVTRRLAAAGIPYMVTSSIAVNYYAVPRMTRDIRRVSVDEQELFVAPEDLILSKLESAKSSRSEVQLGDVRNLLMSVSDLDREYLAGWADRLSVGALYREVCG